MGMTEIEIAESDNWSAEAQDVANLCRYVLDKSKIIPLDTEGMIAFMLEHRPRGVPQNEAQRVDLHNQRYKWRIAWQGCKALKRGQVTVESVLV